MSRSRLALLAGAVFLLGLWPSSAQAQRRVCPWCMAAM
jgi:hypothetical protein